MSEPVRSSAPVPTEARCRGRRVWLFRLAAIGLSLFPFVVLEIGLRVLGCGHDTRLIVRVPGAAVAGNYRLNPAADRAYFGPLDVLGPEPRPFALPKPAGLYRILVVGGSTVAGFPYPSDLALPRHLEIVLQQQLPDRRFEVLNAGITAINTHSEVDVVRQGLACQPDLILVHSGHNEFYGPGGEASTASGIAPRLYPWMQTLRRQRLFQLANSLVPPPPKAHLLETLPADIAIPLGGPVFTRALQRYEANLRDMKALAARVPIPILLTTVPCNLRDQSPMQSLSRQDLNEQQQRELAGHWRSVAHFLSYREFEAALSVLQTARQIDPTSAILAYREAQCLEMLGQTRAAAEGYVLAADLDGCRFRAPSAFDAVVQRVASADPGHVLVCDVASRLREQSESVPGEDLFLEHVHYNLEGNWRVALILGQFIHQQLLHADWRPERIPSGERRDLLLGLTPFDRLAANTFALMAVQAWPLKLAPDSVAQSERLKAQLRREHALLSPLDREIFAALSLDAIQHNLLVSMGNRYRAAGREDLAREMDRLHQQRRPWEASIRPPAAAIPETAAAKSRP